MAARIDTSVTTEVEVGGGTFTIATLTARASIDARCCALDAGQILEEFGDDDQVTGKALRDVHRRQYRILQLGLVEEDPDKINPECWTELCAAILSANSLTEDDAKNSQSA